MVCRIVPIFALIGMTSTLLAATPKVPTLQLHTRSREAGGTVASKPKTSEKTINWDPQKTAVIVVDMWDGHWCKGAAKRVAELAAPLNKFVADARHRGVLVVYCPSTCVDFYKDTAARLRAIDAPYAKPPIKLASSAVPRAPGRMPSPVSGSAKLAVAVAIG